jgi:cytochrome c peroxidase
MGTAIAFPVTTVFAEVIDTPLVIPELPIEIETEVSPAGSLKIVPLWKETVELLENPHAYVCPDVDDPATQSDERVKCMSTTERRPRFGPPGDGTETDTMPPLRVFDACHNVLTAQPLRMRPDEEIDWNQPGYLFDPDEIVAVQDPSQSGGNVSNIPIELRTPIGILVECPRPSRRIDPFPRCRSACSRADDGSLAVCNPRGPAARRVLGLGGNRAGAGQSDDRIPPHRTVIAESACNAAGQLVTEDEGTGEIVVVDELEQPVNENHFIKDRLMAEVLGKALFWDMQIGSDGVQACGSCHAFAGADHRTRNQVNPNTLGGDLGLEIQGGIHTNTNEIVLTPADFPLVKRSDPDTVGEGVITQNVNDVVSSMGVIGFKQFEDVLVAANGTQNALNTAFLAPQGEVRALKPDVGTPSPEPIGVMEGNRRIEPRNTPTIHSAAFNFDQFWDGRARHDFNGGSVFGPSDPFFHVYVSCGSGPGYGQGAKALRKLAAPIEAEEGPGRFLCGWTEEGEAENLVGVAEGEGPVPVRIRFSSLASQALGPPLSDFEMAFGFVDPNVQGGRNWQKIGKKFLQGAVNPTANYKVTPLAKQLVDPTDSRLGPWSNNMGTECIARGLAAPNKPGLCTTYRELIRAAFRPELWVQDTQQHLAGTAVPMNNDCEPGEQIHEEGIQATCDPFDGYVIEISDGKLANIGDTDTDKFKLEEANFSLFFGLAVQAYEQLLIPDETPWDKFNDQYPLIGNGIAQPGEQGTLRPHRIRELVTGDPNGSIDTSVLDRPGIDGDDVLFGFDIFAGGNLTAALPVGSPRNPATPEHPLGVGSNPFLRTARCMLCHLGPEQTDHTNNVNAGLLLSGTEQEFPFPQNDPEPTGVLRLVTGFSLAEELEENAQDGVEVENRNFNIFGTDLSIPPGCIPEPGFPNGTNCRAPMNAQIGQTTSTAFQDNGVYNIGVRPTNDDLLRGGDDPFGFPLSLAALALKNIGGIDFEPCDTETEFASRADGCAMSNFDASQGPGGGLFEAIGTGFPFPGTTYEQDSINPGLKLEPTDTQLPEYLAEWANHLPAGEANPLIDELAFAPNTVTQRPVTEYTEILFGADMHCGIFDVAAFGSTSPNFGWGPRCPNSQTGVPTNVRHSQDRNGSSVTADFEPGALVAPLNGTFPFPNRVARNGAAKAPQLRNVELTGPYFHTGSYLTLRQVVDFYIRGGDFPVTNQEDRDPNLVDVTHHAFSFGSTVELMDLFLDGIPDGVSQYSAMPDTNPPGCAPGGDPLDCTREPANSHPEAAKDALVKFLLSLTDERVAHRSAPFDQPEIFVPIDGQAPEDDQGRSLLVTLSGQACGPADTCFQQIPATGRAGQPDRLPGFLNTASIPGAASPNQFDRITN